MPDVTCRGGECVRKWSFNTSAQEWNCRETSSETYAIDCSAVITDLLLNIDPLCRAGDLPFDEAWTAQRMELPQRVAAAADSGPPGESPAEH